MKKMHMLTLLTASLLLGACSSFNGGGQIVINNDSNYYNDKSVTIVDNEEENDYDTDKGGETESNVETPETFDELENNVISAGGNYRLSGEYASVSITATKNSEVYVFLDGVSINSTTGIAFGSSNKITLISCC